MERKTVIFVYPRIGPFNVEARVPLSVMTLCPGLEAAGYKPVIIDPRVEPDWEDKLLRHLGGALYVGISTMTGRQLLYALDVARFVRDQDPSVPLVWGGVHPSLFPSETLSHSLVDLVAEGEGEGLVVDLARCLEEGGDLGKVKGLHHVDEKGNRVFGGRRPLVDMEEAPIPAWHLVHPDRYFGIGVETARGCPWRCRFCFNMNFNRGRWRARSVRMLLEEMALLKKRYGQDMVWLVDDNFFTVHSRVERFCNGLLEQGMDMGWSTTARAGSIAGMDDDFIVLLKRAGMKILFVGVESGSPATLDYIRKDCTVEDIEVMAWKGARHDLGIHCSMVVGFPEETPEDRAMTFDLMDRLKAIHPGIVLQDIFIFTPYPGTDLYEEAISKGFVPPTGLEGWANYSFYDCNLPWMSSRERETLQNLPLITRLQFWGDELESRHIKPYMAPFYKVVQADARLRWQERAFSVAPEFTMMRKLLEARKKVRSKTPPTPPGE